MDIAVGDTVTLRDKREILVTDVSDDHAFEPIPNDNILIGTNVKTGKIVVTDLSEVAAVLANS